MISIECLSSDFRSQDGSWICSAFCWVCVKILLSLVPGQFAVLNPLVGLNHFFPYILDSHHWCICANLEETCSGWLNRTDQRRNHGTAAWPRCESSGTNVSLLCLFWEWSLGEIDVSTSRIWCSLSLNVILGPVWLPCFCRCQKNAVDSGHPSLPVKKGARHQKKGNCLLVIVLHQDVNHLTKGVKILLWDWQTVYRTNSKALGVPTGSCNLNMRCQVVTFFEFK